MIPIVIGAIYAVTTVTLCVIGIIFLILPFIVVTAVITVIITSRRTI